MQICNSLFLASGEFCDIKTVPCSDASEEQSNQTETLKLMLVTTFDVEPYSQHTLEIPVTVRPISRNTRDDAHQCHCSYPQRTGSEVWIGMEDLASTDCQVLIVLVICLQHTGKKIGVILGPTIRTELYSFTIFPF